MGGLVVGLDEVGRGPLAGPLAVGAVVLPDQPHILGLNDSKQVKPNRARSLLFASRRLRLPDRPIRFTRGYRCRWDDGFVVACVSGCPCGSGVSGRKARHGAARWQSIAYGSARGERGERRRKCASIAAASIVAKVERDALMCEYARQYPESMISSNKGYASAAHIQAIKDHGLCPIHRGFLFAMRSCRKACFDRCLRSA